MVKILAPLMEDSLDRKYILRTSEGSISDVSYVTHNINEYRVRAALDKAISECRAEQHEPALAEV
jgi:hypothetical protein